MIFRFSLYGFLKNQKYFEPVFFLILLHDKGLSYTMLGLFLGFGALCVNILEVPSGALADLYGRRRSMILSFLSYIISFIIYALADRIFFLFVAMFLFSLGDAFRTGTHKAMIFDWLRLQGRVKERTMVYGYTRSWSKIGSSVSAVIAVLFLLSWKSLNPEGMQYSQIFWLCIIPYSIGIINFLGYPKELDGEIRKKVFLRTLFYDLFYHLWNTLKDVVKISMLRRLFLESMSFEGLFRTVRDYVQPLANQMVLGLSFFLLFEDKDLQIIFVVYSIYFVMNLFASYASRQAFKLSEKMGGEEHGCRLIWWSTFFLYCTLLPFLYFEFYICTFIVFISLHFLQNIWRPMLLSRFDMHSRPETGATILSLESQAKSLFMIIAAPMLGFSIDFINKGSFRDNFWPIAAMGLIVTFLIIVTGFTRQRTVSKSMLIL